MRRVALSLGLVLLGFVACTLDQQGAGAGGDRPDAGSGASGGDAGNGGAAGSSFGGTAGNAGSGGAGCFPGPNEKACGDTCVNVNDPAFGCAAPGCSSCVVPNATPVCSGVNCAIGSCAAGFDDCNTDAVDGCEINIDQDPRNCGGCGNDCFANTTADNWRCVAGKCEVSSCPLGFEDCNQDPSDGCEVDLNSSVGNCGFCSNPCNLANATAQCNAGQCEVGSCDSGYGDCDGTAANGCEVNTQVDADHCGACNRGCSTSHVNQRTCAAGVCTSSCDNGWGNCSRPATGADNGCETNTNTSAANCGGCGAACSTSHSSAQTCSSGQCTHTCQNGFGDCDAPRPGSTDNGCEVNLQNSKNNCGACGAACSTSHSTGQTCSGGQCQHTCQGAYRDCNGTRPGATDDGCEVDTDTSVANCGSCNAACSSTNVSTRTCAGGQCTPTCATGFGDCNGPAPGSSDDGCELDWSSNDSKCGSCTAGCMASQHCDNSMCVPNGNGGNGGTGGAGGTGSGATGGAGSGGTGGT
ncbi:MAG: hypothetical protein R3B07_32705 [Polyangiaceae bacterium]